MLVGAASRILASAQWQGELKTGTSATRTFESFLLVGPTSRLVAAHRLVTREDRVEHTLAAREARQLLLEVLRRSAETVIRQLGAETDVTLALIGGTSARELDASWIAAPPEASSDQG